MDETLDVYHSFAEEIKAPEAELFDRKVGMPAILGAPYNFGPSPVFVPFQKIARLNREIVVTEKIDGTNASIHIGDDGTFRTASRSKWITPGKHTDNAGFAAWAYEHKEELLLLGPGAHFGEWWGRSIQRNYGLQDKRFSLFNTGRWQDAAVRPGVVGVVPVLYQGAFDTDAIRTVLSELERGGSQAAPGFGQPEGIVIYHTAAKQLFKVTIKNDEKPKSQQEK